VLPISTAVPVPPIRTTLTVAGQPLCGSTEAFNSVNAAASPEQADGRQPSRAETLFEYSIGMAWFKMIFN
jgi:hypothetical protein